MTTKIKYQAHMHLLQQHAKHVNASKLLKELSSSQALAMAALICNFILSKISGIVNGFKG